MRYLTEAEIKDINHGLPNLHVKTVMNPGALQSAAQDPGRVVYGTELHKTLGQKAAALVYPISQNHPFGDGNGRTGRLLMVLQCLEEGFPPVVIENARKADYYDVLEYAQKKSDGPFICFLADEMEKTARLMKRFL